MRCGCRKSRKVHTNFSIQLTSLKRIKDVGTHSSHSVYKRLNGEWHHEIKHMRELHSLALCNDLALYDDRTTDDISFGTFKKWLINFKIMFCNIKHL